MLMCLESNSTSSSSNMNVTEEEIRACDERIVSIIDEMSRDDIVTNDCMLTGQHTSITDTDKLINVRTDERFLAAR